LVGEVLASETSPVGQGSTAEDCMMSAPSWSLIS
jgi:hypothetical protein